MFKNRWGALLFVCLTAAGAASLIGGEDEQGVLLSTTDQLAQTRSDLTSQMAELSETEERPVQDVGGEDQLATDEELIDDARGFDPVPDLNLSDELRRVEEEGDVIMIIEDD